MTNLELAQEIYFALEARQFDMDSAGFIAVIESVLDKCLASREADNAKLRAGVQQIADGNPAPPGGKWLSAAKMAQIARSILSNVEAAS